jgi:hypothetical protein
MAFRIVKDNLVDVVYTGVNRIGASTYEPDEAIATSYLGTPIYSNLEIQNGQFKDVTTGDIVKYEGLRIDSVLFTVSREKNMVVTEIQGRDGSIKELIANKDYTIQINGFLVSNKVNTAPINEKNALIKICNAKASIEVISSFLNDFGIYNMVIQNYSLAESQGKRSTIEFTLSCLSDTPFDLELQSEA